MFLFLLQLVTFSYAFPWNGPAETTAKWFNHDSSALGPKPTPPPKANLNRRQAPGDSTCGFFNATSSDAIYCLDGTANVCATDSNFGWGCCSVTDLDSNCRFGTTCIDSTALSNFDSAYLATANVWICAESTAAYCTTDYLEANGYEYTGYGCYQFSYSDTYYTTYLQGTTPGNFTATLLNGVYIPLITPPSSSPSSSSSSTTTPSTSTPSPSPTQPPTHPSSSSTGAIAGGVVGGVALIVIFGIVAFYFFRKSRKYKRNAGITPYNSEYQRQGGPPVLLTQRQSTQDGDYQHSYAQPTFPVVGGQTKPTSPISMTSSSGPMSYTSESKHGQQRVASSQSTAVDDSQIRVGGRTPELDGRIHGDYERY